MKPYLCLVSILLLSFAACKNAGEQKSDSHFDILAADIDSTMSPGADFAAYANGGWTKNNPIPESESAWTIGHLVKEEIYNKLQKISETAAKSNAAKGSTDQKIGDFYAAAMDSTQIEKQGVQPLSNELNQIKQINNLSGVLKMSALLQTYATPYPKNFPPLFELYVGQDMKNSAVQALYLNQGGLSLPNRDYYFNTDNHSKTIREAFPAYIVSILTLSGADQATAGKQSKAIAALETNLAKSSRKLEDLRDPYKNYNKMAIKDLNKLTPSIQWDSLLVWMKIPKVDSIIVGQPEFFKTLETNLKNTSIEDWKAYLTFHFLNCYTESLSSNFEKAGFDFYGSKVFGAKVQRPRWKKVLDAEENAMGDLLGQLFVKEYFSPATKKRYEKLVDDILAAYKNRIDKLDWMSAATKAKALSKLSKITKKVGYPDKWKDYSTLETDRSSYVRNSIRANQWRFYYQVNKLGKPVDRTEWDMTPQTYNAYYNPSNNEIVLPAAIFTVPGVPDEQLDDAIVYAYGGGSTIGHEITHGFDDEGRQFDENGNLSDWWTKEDGVQFNKRADVMVKQFNDYVVLDSMHINGKACLGENIADLGGVLLGLDAFKNTEQYKSGKAINGLTPIQRYFLGYALSWLGHQRNERLANQIMTDVHAPAFLRINGPVVNIPEFYDAFGVKPGDKMFRADSLRVKIW